MRAGIGPGDARTGGAKQRRARNDLVAHAQRHVAPFGPSAVQVGAVDQISNPNGGAESVGGEALEMVDQILTCVIFLRHGSVRGVLVTEVAMEIDFGGHHGLAGEIDACGSGGDRELATAADAGEESAVDDEGGVFDGRAAVASDESRAFKHGNLGGRLAGQQPEPSRGQEKEASRAHDGYL